MVDNLLEVPVSWTRFPNIHVWRELLVDITVIVHYESP